MMYGSLAPPFTRNVSSQMLLLQMLGICPHEDFLERDFFSCGVGLCFHSV